MPLDETVLNAEGLITGEQSKSIINADERVRIPDFMMNQVPYSCVGVVIARFADGTSGKGTGFLFGSNDVATAAHVIHKRNAATTSIIFYPGVNGPLGPKVGFKATEVATPKEYFDSNSPDL